MVHIVVNGQLVLRDGSLTGEKPGRVLKGPARRPGRYRKLSDAPEPVHR
jgi:N-acyl-D-aspartate/D-glutamate deacylase